MAICLRELLLFDVDELQRTVETQVGESVLYMARFRECAARSLFLPRTRPGKRVPLWQQRLKAAQLLNAARTCKNFPSCWKLRANACRTYMICRHYARL